MGTPSYIKNAQNRYNAKFDIIQGKFPKGTKEKIQNLTGENYSSYIKRVVLADLERLEKGGKINAELAKINEKAAKGAEFDQLNDFIKQKQAENERKRAEKSVLLEPSRAE